MQAHDFTDLTLELSAALAAHVPAAQVVASGERITVRSTDEQWFAIHIEQPYADQDSLSVYIAPTGSAAAEPIDDIAFDEEDEHFVSELVASLVPTIREAFVR